MVGRAPSAPCSSEADSARELLKLVPLVISETVTPFSSSLNYQENISRLFKEIIQFNPEKLQAGGGSGLGLFSTCVSILSPPIK